MDKSLISDLKKIALMLIAGIFLIILFISLFHIIIWFKDNNTEDKQIDKVNELTLVNEKEDTITTEIIKQDVEVDKFNPYWDYIKMNLIDVDFTDLLKENSDTVGWIQVNGTNINYPIVQTTDNSFYLTHSFNRSNNSAGWVFADYRNNMKELNKNTIIYAHGRLNGTMFGSLRKILESNWLDNTNNYVVKLSTLTENTLWQVFSVYHIPTTSDYIQTEFSDNIEFLKLANILKDRSAYNFNTTVSQNDHILTLSTCYSDTEKVVLHAKLIKRDKKIDY